MMKIIALLVLFSFSCISNTFATTLTQAKQISLKENKLSLSLPKISNLYNISFVADANTLQNIRHPDIRGNYTLEKLLTLLLKKQPIKFQLIDCGVVLTPISSSAIIKQPANQKIIEHVTVVGSKLSIQSISPLATNRQNLTDALNAQYNNDHLGEYIGYSGLTALPSHNVAEAISYLPGISISRFFGEGLTVNARGLGPLYQTTSLNGHLLAINENVRNSGQSGRAFRFDVLPIQGIAQINIIKTPTADMTDSGIGSSIAIEMFKPLAFEKEHFIASTSIDYGDKSKKTSPQVSWLNNWLNSDKNLGVVLTGSFSERSIKQESLQTWDWELNGNSYLLPSLPNNTIIPSNRVALTVEQEQRENTSLGLAIQWQATDNLLLSTDHFYSRLSANFNEQRLLARLDSHNESVNNTNIHDFNVIDNTLIAASFNELMFKTALETSQQQHHNYIGIFDVNWQPNNWLVDFSIAHSTAASKTPQPIRRTRYNVAPQPFSFSFPVDGSNNAEFQLDEFPLKLNQFEQIDHISARQIDVNDDGLSVHLSVSHPINIGIFNELIFGTQWRQQNRHYFRQDQAISQQHLNELALNKDYFQLQPTEFSLTSVTASNTPFHWLSPNEKVQQTFEELLRFNQPTQADLVNSYRLEEQNQAAFVRLNYESKLYFPITGNIGLRQWQWQAKTTGGIEQKSSISKQNQWLTNINANLKFTPQWQLKLSVAQTVSLPSYTDFNPSITLNSTDGVLLARGGNPLLKPISAYQWDSALHWYFTEEANISIGYFQKNIDNFIIKQAKNQQFNEKIYRFTQPNNNGNATINGWEFSYQQNFPYDFGLQYNLTLIDSQVKLSALYGDISSQLEGVSDLSYSLLAFYEANPWRLRIGFDHRSAHLAKLSVTDVPSSWLTAQQALKFYLGFQLSDTTTISFSGRNLFTKPQQNYFNTKQHTVTTSITESEKNLSLSITKTF